MRIKMLATTISVGMAMAGPTIGQTTDKTRIGGKMYFDLTVINKLDHGQEIGPSGVGLDVKRFYLDVQHRFDNIWSANLTTDFNYESNDGETQLYVKKAYLQGAFSDLATLRVGAASTAWVPLVEDWYGYRFVEKVMVDRLDFGTSSDWGLHLLGGNGVFNYQVSAINGAGYKNPSRSSRMDFEFRVGANPIEGLLFAVGAYSGDRGKGNAASPAVRAARRYDAMVAWRHSGLRLGVAWFKAENWDNVTAMQSDSASGRSLWVSYDFKPLSIFARQDSVDPSETLDPSLENRYWNAGVSIPLAAGVKLAVAYKREHLRNATSINTETSEFGVWAQVEW